MAALHSQQEKAIFLATDVRFDNEARFVVENDGYIFRINRDCQRIENSNHVSEAGLSDSFPQKQIIDIDNNGSIDDLESQLRTHLRYILDMQWKV